MLHESGNHPNFCLSATVNFSLFVKNGLTGFDETRYIEMLQCFKQCQTNIFKINQEPSIILL